MKTKRFLTLAGTLVLALALTVSWAVRRGAARVIEGEAGVLRQLRQCLSRSGEERLRRRRERQPQHPHLRARARSSWRPIN
jgi:hypothetical protein